MANLTKAQQADRDKAIAELLQLIKPGGTIRLILRHTSRSGMRRRISLLFVDSDGMVYHLDNRVDRALNPERRQKACAGEGVQVDGCGMDMGFDLVYRLGRALWPQGFACISFAEPYRCPSNDHSNGDHPLHHSDGGYALEMDWI